MNEISCRVFGVFFREVKRKKLSPDVLIAGTGVELSRFLDKNERVDWSAFCRFMENCERVWTDDELVELGGIYLHSPFLRPVIVIARLLFTAHDLYLWTFDQQKGSGRQLFSCIEASYLKLEKNHIVLDVHFSDGYPKPCHAYFLISKGAYQDLPLLVGEPKAKVETELTERGAIYDIRVPEGGGSLRWLRKAVTYPVTVKAAARELKEAHELLVKRYDELSDYRENLERKVEERTAELVEAQRARDRIFANVNHEIRTPLSLILLAVEELRRTLTDVNALAGIGTIEQSARQLLRLIESLLLLAARQEEKLTIRKQPFDVAELLTRVVEIWMPAATSLGVELQYEGPKSCVATLDASDIERITANLLSNALKFTPQGGRVVIALQHDNVILELSVADTGPGIGANMRDRLFGRFEQGESATRPGVRGSGVGLSLVKELVEAHGGTVTVESEPGHGSVFRVRIPCSREPSSVMGRQYDAYYQPSDFGHSDPSRARNAEIEGPQNASHTILVAEDDHPLRETIGKILSVHYHVLLAPNGQEALKLARLHKPDLLITDIAMPEMDGITLTREWRKIPGNDLAPVIVLTAYGAIENRLAGFEAGALDFVLKPFEPIELLARVRSQIQMRSMTLQLLETERLRVDAANYQAKAAEAYSLSIARDAEREKKELSQQFSRKLIDSQEQERKRIAGELHDGIGQDLLIIKHRVMLAMEDASKLSEHLQEIAEISDEAIDDVRRLSRDLRPYQLERVGLTESLNTMLKSISESAAVNIHFSIDPLDGFIPSEHEINLYRIVQEGLNNVLKHAEAKNAEVSIRRKNGELSLTICDDGKGFDARALRKERSSGGFGLIGMGERIQMMEGTFEIQSSPGHGMKFHAVIPVHES